MKAYSFAHGVDGLAIPDQRRFYDVTDRITDLEGKVMYDGLTPEEAVKKRKELRNGGVPHLHERWCGTRTGWNNVTAYYGDE